MQKPSIGRIVHFVVLVNLSLDRVADRSAAIITGVGSDSKVNLKVFHDGDGSGLWFRDVPYRDARNTEIQYAGHYWEWPPRVE